MFQHEFRTGSALIIGGAKSGKSRVALNLCGAAAPCRIFLATAQAWDEEMETRITRHRLERGPEWQTVEEPLRLGQALRKNDGPDRVILVDCLTLWLSNLYMHHGESEECIVEEIDHFADTLLQIEAPVVLVSNEVGMGIVPDNSLSRGYRDAAGLMNQKMAAMSRKVVFVVAGLPVVLKDE